MKYNKKTLLHTLCTVVLVSMLIFACEFGTEMGSVGGFVYQNGTTTPIVDALISINGSNATTSSVGFFLIEDVPVGAYTLTASKSGFTTYNAQVMLDDTSTVSHTVYLSLVGVTTTVTTIPPTLTTVIATTTTTVTVTTETTSTETGTTSTTVTTTTTTVTTTETSTTTT